MLCKLTRHTPLSLISYVTTFKMVYILIAFIVSHSGLFLAHCAIIHQSTFLLKTRGFVKVSLWSTIAQTCGDPAINGNCLVEFGVTRIVHCQFHSVIN